MRKKIKVDNLLGVVWQDYPAYYELYNVTETPHFKFLNGDKQHYVKYMDPDIKGMIHSSAKFNDLIKSMDQCKLEDLVNNISIDVFYNDAIKKYVVLDGLHRLSILTHRNADYVNIKITRKKSLSKSICTNIDKFK